MNFNKLLTFFQGVVIVYSQLTILQPESLKSLFYPNGTIEYSLGNFGYVPYGQQLTAILKISDHNDGCSMRPVNQGDYPQSQAILIERGNCTFGRKAYEAERAGFTLVIIVDNVNERVKDIEMISKNHSLQVNIPTILISHQDGEKLTRHINSNSKTSDVFISLKFQTPNTTGVVDYHYWMSSLDLDSYSFIEQFRPFHKELLIYLNFTPHYTMWQCQYCKTKNWTTINEQCLSGGRYCAFDPDQDGPLNGRDSVWENLRQICIYKHHPIIWWDYMVEFGQSCLRFSNLTNSPQDTNKCALKIQNKFIPNNKTIHECIWDNFVGGEKAKILLANNKVLEDERQFQLQEGIQSYPVLSVNGQLYRGSLYLPIRNTTINQPIFDTAHYGPLQMVCQGFKQQHLPKLCRERMRMYIDEQGKLVQHDSSMASWLVWTLSIIGLTILMIFTIFCYRRQMRKRMQQELSLQVNMAISQYFSMNEKEKSFSTDR